MPASVRAEASAARRDERAAGGSELRPARCAENGCEHDLLVGGRMNSILQFLVLQDERLTFAGFLTQVQRLAGVMQARGVGPGDRVVLYLARRTRYLTAYLAAMAAGAIPVHLYPERPASYVDFAATHTGAGLVITDQEQEEAWSSFPHPLLHYPDLSDANLPKVWPGPYSDAAYMMFTSGTTGQPKAVVTTQENVLFVTQTLIGMAGMNEEDREVIVMPLGSTGGLGHFHANLVLGNRTILLPYFFGSMSAADLEQMLETIADEGITGFLATPGMLGRLAAEHRELFREKARKLRYVLTNVCPMRPDLVRDLMDLLPGTRFHTYYGLTEASRSVYQCYNDHPAHVSAAGRPAPGVNIRIDQPDVDQPNQAGVGEVLIQGGNVMAGYWGRGRDGFDGDGWFHSGDLGSIDAEGFLTIRGRVRDNINVDGLKFLPREIEDVLLAHPAVDDCAVVGLPDPIRYQRAGAMVVLAQQADRSAMAAELKTWCGERLDFYKVPVLFYFADSIPRSELGKINRDALIELMNRSSSR
jgi:long-chain acyl-CoA synthetase